MNSIRATFLAVSALALLGTTAAQAESYDGVHAPAGALGRSAVQAEAVRTAAARDQNVVRGSRGAETVAVSQARAGVQAEAVRTAAAPDQNVSSGSRVNSRVVSTMRNPVDVRAEAQARNTNAAQ
ncbi:DUF4148 domain-containing protein [Xenophilus aerolatus]|nr:DUF4148 domain-containing protein [Xenophilus aerolatus]